VTEREMKLKVAILVMLFIVFLVGSIVEHLITRKLVKTQSVLIGLLKDELELRRKQEELTNKLIRLYEEERQGLGYELVE